MMQNPELLLQPTWPNYSFECSPFDQKVMMYDQEMDLCLVDDSGFSYSFITSPDQDSSVMSSNSYIPAAMIGDEYLDLRDSCNVEFQACSSMDGLDSISKGDIESICEWINEDVTMEGDDGCSPSLASDSNQHDGELTLIHLLKAYGEAVENGEKELGEVVVGAINVRSSPVGNTTERVAYSLFGSGGELLREEVGTNLMAAFRVIYQSLPDGRFAHFTANAAILDSIPHDAGEVQIVDFDIGEGVQWPPLIEALRGKGKTVTITSLRVEEECASSRWKFEETKKRLMSHAKQCGVKLQVEEKSVEEVGVEMMRLKRRGWVAFNCMVGLPHMGRRRPRTSVEGFLEEGKAMVAEFGGIVVLGDGEAREDSDSCCGYSSYFEGLQRHYQAVFESLEGNFPVYLAEARTAVESLFLGPLMCPIAWFQDWEETRKSQGSQTGMRLEGRKLRLERLAEAKEMVVERENLYSVKIEGVREHEMVLQWRETPLVRVSTWM